MRFLFVLITFFCYTLTWAQWDIQAALQELNDLRDEGCNCGTEKMRPASALLWDKDLAAIATDYAEQLATTNQGYGAHVYLSHVGTDGSTLEDRLQEQAYRAKACVENIAYFNGNFTMVLDHWLNNPQSCKNLLNKNMTAVGLAQKDNYWVIILALPQNATH